MAEADNRPKAITLDDLPSIDDHEGLVDLAASFNGYMVYGSFQGAAEAADRSTRSTLDEVRAELFMAYRVGNHRCDDTLIVMYRELEPYFRRLLVD